MNRRSNLPVVTGCERRQFLQGIGLAALLSACGGSGESPVEPDVDAAVGPDGEPLTPGFEACAGGICLDLTVPANAALANVEGSRVITFESRAILIVRTSETQFAALTARCPHQGTTVRYDDARDDIVCPNHGSRFTLEGAVTKGPATRPLDLFATTFDAGTNLLTVQL